MSIIYVWYWQRLEFIPLLLIEDSLSNHENMTLCKERNCSGIVKKITFENAANTTFSRFTDLVFDFNDPRDVEVKINDTCVYPFMFTKSTPFDYTNCPYSESTVYVHKAASWFEARVIDNFRLPENWNTRVFKNDGFGPVVKHCQNLKPYVWPIFESHGGVFSFKVCPLYKKIVREQGASEVHAQFK